MSGRRGRAAVVAAVLLAGCTDGGADGDRSERDERPASAELAVTAPEGEVPADEVVVLEIVGAPPGARVEVEVTSTDDEGMGWSSTTTRAADDEGRVVLDEEPMEPFTGLVPDDRAEDIPYVWSLDGNTFTIAVRAPDRDPAEVEVRRRLLAEGVTQAETTLEADGVQATLWSPAPGTAVGSAVVFIGGSGGGRGLPVDAAALASRGVVALQMAYFGEPGLPEELTEIPLETFLPAIERVRREPGVDPDRVWLAGISRGSEAAVLVAARHPDLVAGVLLGAPGADVVCGLPDCDRSAWTEGGVPLPFTRRTGQDDPAAALPVEDVDGPVIATCGGADVLWPSCPQAEDLLARRDPAHPQDHLASDPGAGHRTALFTPYAWPITPGSDDPRISGDPQADDRVRADAWPRILEALGAAAP